MKILPHRFFQGRSVEPHPPRTSQHWLAGTAQEGAMRAAVDYQGVI
jgi:hypothetical protein